MAVPTPPGTGKWVLTGGSFIEAINGALTVQGNQKWAYVGATSASITSISPTSGPTSGGTTVTITGAGFNGTNTVNFGTTPVKFTFVSDSLVTAITKPGTGTVDVTVVTTNDGTTSVTPASQFSFVPPVTQTTQLGVFVGTGEGQAGSPALVAAFAASTNAIMTLAHDYLPWAANTGLGTSGWAYLTSDANFSSWMTNWIGTTYRMLIGIPMVCLSPAGVAENTLAQGAAGTMNANWTAIGQNLIKAGFSNAILRLGWEFDGNWYPWMVTNTADATDFVAYWQQIVTTLRSVPGANFQFMWSPAGFADTYPTVVQGAYPGNSYVDYVSLDCYDWSWNNTIFTNGDPGNTCTVAQSNAQFSQFESGFTIDLNWLASFSASVGKPFGLAECAVVNRNDGHGLGDDQTYLNNVATWMRTSGATFLVYFSGPPDGVATYTLASFPNSLAAFKSNFGTPKVNVTSSEMLGQQFSGTL